MELITTKDIIDRLLMNPIMKGLRMSSVAYWVKDFSSINDIQPLLEMKSAILTVKEYKAILPVDCLRPKHIYICLTDGRKLDSSLFEDNKLSASNTDAILREPYKGRKKNFYGAYQVMDDVITLDMDEGLLEVQYIRMRVDSAGFPTLPYDGSLMQSITNYVKWKHTEILLDNQMVNASVPAKAEREYIWYMGQYHLKTIVPSYDEALSLGNVWTRLLNTRNKSKEGTNLEQHYNW